MVTRAWETLSVSSSISVAAHGSCGWIWDMRGTGQGEGTKRFTLEKLVLSVHHAWAQSSVESSRDFHSYWRVVPKVRENI